EATRAPVAQAPARPAFRSGHAAPAPAAASVISSSGLSVAFVGAGRSTATTYQDARRLTSPRSRSPPATRIGQDTHRHGPTRRLQLRLLGAHVTARQRRPRRPRPARSGGDRAGRALRHLSGARARPPAALPHPPGRRP